MGIARRGTVVAAIALLLASAASAADTVVLLNGQRHTGTVLRDDAEKVALRTRGEVEFASSQVREVIYDDGRPESYTLGKVAYLERRYDQAVNYLVTALDQQPNKLLVQYIYYYEGLAHDRLGENEEAVACFEKLWEMGNATRFWMEAGNNLVPLYLNTGNVAKAEKVIKEISGNDRARAQVNVWRAMILEKQKRYDQAIKAYREAASDARSRQPEIASEAEIGIARCQIYAKSYSEAARSLRSLIQGTEDNGIRARCYVLLGDALAAQARSSAEYEEAVMAYLRVPTLYPGSQETEAKALFEAGNCFKKMGGQVAEQRAGMMYALLKRKYPDSLEAGQLR